MLVIAIIVVAVGLAMILVGVAISVIDWHRKNEAAKKQEMETRGLGAAEDINALRKLMVALRSQPLGAQLIGYGIAVVIIGGAIGGVSEILAAVR